MVGAEEFDIEHRYQLLTGGPAVELISLSGPFVKLKDGTWAEIVEYYSKEKLSFSQNKLANPRVSPDNYHPAGELPSDAVLVVRTSALQELEALFLSDPEPAIERAIERRERTTLLVIIAALAKLAKVDVTKPSSAATAIESQTSLMGARVAARTIENHLKRIPEALENKSED